MKTHVMLEPTAVKGHGHHQTLRHARALATDASARTLAPAGTRAWHGKLPRLTQFVHEYLVVLPLGAAIAIAWVNLAPESYYRFAYATRFAVNDLGMVLFFALVAKEVVEARAPGGVLHSWRRTALPVIGAVGATIVPALLYVAFVRAMDEPMLDRGWTVPMAIDVAIAYVVARAIFPRHPVVPFVLLLALAADALGFVSLALFFPARQPDLVTGALLMAGAIGITAMLRLRRVRSFWPYVLAGGSVSWLALFVGGFHPAFALLPIVPFLPHAARDPGFFVDARPGSRDALNRFELWARYPAHVALFFFALVNAGVPFHGLESGAWAVPVATVVGKPLGILAAIGIAVAAGLHLPPRVGWRDLTVVGLIAATGFTVGLFFATATMAPGQLLRETKLGVLVGLGAIGLAFATARALRVGRFSR